MAERKDIGTIVNNDTDHPIPVSILNDDALQVNIVNAFPVEVKINNDKPVEVKYTGIQSVKVRREVKSRIATHLYQDNLTPDGSTPAYGQLIDVSEAEKILLELVATNLVKGSLSGLKCYVQALSVMAGFGVWYNIPVSIDFPQNPVICDPVAGNNVFGAFYIPACFSIMRIFFTATGKHTSGQIGAILNIKK